MIHHPKVSIVLLIYLENTHYLSSAAFDFITPFCCDRCPCDGNRFNLEDYMPGHLFKGLISTASETKPSNRFRPTWERHGLDLLLIAWVEYEHSQDPFSAFRTPYDILSRTQRDLLVRTQYSAITSASSITNILNETSEWEEEWAEKIYNVIRDYQLVRPPKPRKI